MSLPEPAPRQKLHRRAILVEGFKREDGNYDIDAVLEDTKTHRFSTDRGTLDPSQVLHGLSARMTITPQFEIIDFTVAMDDTPSDSCLTVVPHFKAMIGLVITRGFVRAAYERIGGTLGCTHIRELLQQMATVAMQTTFQERMNRRDPAAPPPLLNTCHGWRADGPMMRNRYPAYYQPPSAERDEEDGSVADGG